MPQCSRGKAAYLPIFRRHAAGNADTAFLKQGGKPDIGNRFFRVFLADKAPDTKLHLHPGKGPFLLRCGRCAKVTCGHHAKRAFNEIAIQNPAYRSRMEARGCSNISHGKRGKPRCPLIEIILPPRHKFCHHLPGRGEPQIHGLFQPACLFQRLGENSPAGHHGAGGGR